MNTHVMTRLMCVDGFEHWICFACGRFLLIRWEPWSKTVVEEGDPEATHSGSKGGLRMGSMEVRQDE